MNIDSILIFILIVTVIYLLLKFNLLKGDTVHWGINGNDDDDDDDDIDWNNRGGKNKYFLGYFDSKKLEKKNTIKKGNKFYKINLHGPIDGDNLSIKDLKKPILIAI